MEQLMTALDKLNQLDYYELLVDTDNIYTLSLYWDENYFSGVLDEISFKVTTSGTFETVEYYPESFETVDQFIQYILS